MYIVLAILDGKNSTAEKRSLRTWYPCVHLLNNNCLPSLPSTCDASKNPRWLDNKGYYFHSATPWSEHDWIERFPYGIFINVFHCGSLGIHNNSVLKWVMYKVFFNNFKTKEQVREYGEFFKAPNLHMQKEKDKDRNKPKQQIQRGKQMKLHLSYGKEQFLLCWWWWFHGSDTNKKKFS